MNSIKNDVKQSVAYYKNRKILGINKRFIEGIGWVTSKKYEEMMYDEKCREKYGVGGCSLFTLIRQYNIQYEDVNGIIGQMDIEVNDFWENRITKSE